MRKINKVNGLIVLVSSLLLSFLTACSSSSGTSEPGAGETESNPDFVAKAKAISFNQLKLYDGHIDADDRKRTELDGSSLESGKLISIEVQFEVNGALTDYVLSAQLIPESVFSKIKPGATLDDVINSGIASEQKQSFIDLGGVQVEGIKPGLMSAFVQTKLPVVGKDTLYKILITPSLSFLSSGKDINTNDLKSMPVLLDSRVISINKLENVAVKIIKAPRVTDDNPFTNLHVGGKFDANGFSIEPIFQTTIDIDLTTFNEDEEIVLSLSWLQSIASAYPLGLLSSDELGNPVIGTSARFKVKKTASNTIKIPVVVYNTTGAEAVLLKASTAIRSIASQSVADGNFELMIEHDVDGVLEDTGVRHNFLVPLVRQDVRAIEATPEQVTAFTVLRAGNTNEACLTIEIGAFNIDTGVLGTNVKGEIIAVPCKEPGDTDYEHMLWQYNPSTLQIVNKEKDSNGDVYCISFVNQPPNEGALFPGDFNLRKCDTDVSGNSVSWQRYIFEGNKIRHEAEGLYLDIVFSNAFVKEVTLTVTNDADTVTDIFRDTNGLDLELNGRLFNVGRFYDIGWGDADLARIELSYGGEAYVNYSPVVGAVAEGRFVLQARVFGSTSELIGTTFATKRHLAKKLTFIADNSPKVKVENGTLFRAGVAGYATFERGELTEVEIKESYDPLGDIGDKFADMAEVEDYNYTPAEFVMDHEFIKFRFFIVVTYVDVTGGAKGKANLKFELLSPGLGIEAKASQELSLSAYVKAKLNLGVIKPGIVGSVELIKQTLDFSTVAGFTTPNTTEFKLEVSSTFDAQLKVLKGEIMGTLDYPTTCLCAPPWKWSTAEKTLYSSPYLYNESWNIFSAELVNSSIGL